MVFDNVLHQTETDTHPRLATEFVLGVLDLHEEVEDAGASPTAA